MDQDVSLNDHKLITRETHSAGVQAFYLKTLATWSCLLHGQGMNDEIHTFNLWSHMFKPQPTCSRCNQAFTPTQSIAQYGVATFSSYSPPSGTPIFCIQRCLSDIVAPIIPP